MSGSNNTLDAQLSQQYFKAVSFNPSVVATDGAKGTVLVYAPLVGAPSFYQKQDTGVTTNWTEFDTGTGAGDIKSDGSIPFAASQSLGGFNLEDVANPIDPQDATTKSYVDTFVKTLGTQTTVYVRKSGNDVTGTGTNDNPFLTLDAAQTAITTATATNPYVLDVGPGTFLEVNTYSPKQFVSIKGAGRVITTIKRTDSSTIPINYVGSISFTQVFKDITFSASVTIARIAGSAPPITVSMTNTFLFLEAGVTGTLTMTGSGYTSAVVGVAPFNFDLLTISGGSYSSITVNAVNLRLHQTNTLTCTYTDVGVDATSINSLAQTLVGSSTLFQNLTGLIAVSAHNTQINRVTLNGTSPTFNGSSNSFPLGGNAANGVLLLTGATMNQIGKFTISNRHRNMVKTVLVTPNTLDTSVDHIIVTNLTVPGPVALTMPTMTAGNFAEGIPFVIIDGKGDAATNNVTMTAGGTDTFEGGATTDVINTNYGSKSYYYSLGVWRSVVKVAASGANTALSNLAATAINTDLIFNTASDANLQTKDAAALTKTLAVHTGNSSADASGGINMYSGSAAANFNTGTLGVGSGGALGTGASGDFYLDTGNAVDGNSGLLLLQTGAVSGTGASGPIDLLTGATDQASGDIGISTGNSANGNSGDVSIGCGTAVNGVRGKIKLQNGLIFDAAITGEIKTINAVGTGSENMSVKSGDSDNSATGDIHIKTGTPALDQDSGAVSIRTAGATGTGPSGGITIAPGSSVNGPSGDISLNLNAPSGTGAIGRILFLGAGEGTPGKVWTEGAVAGSGSWAAPAAGAPVSAVDLVAVNHLVGTIDAGIPEGGYTVDGTNTAVGGPYRVLVIKQGTFDANGNPHNGIYLTDPVAQWTRVADLNTTAEFYQGLKIYVKSGVQYRGSSYSIFNLDSPFTLGAISKIGIRNDNKDTHFQITNDLPNSLGQGKTLKFDLANITGTGAVTIGAVIGSNGTILFPVTAACIGVTEDFAQPLSNKAIDVPTTTFTGVGSINAGTHKIINVVDPTTAQGAATKNYVDTTVTFYDSDASAGGSATETLTVTGLAAADSILSVTQRVPGALSTPVIGFANQAANALDITWTLDPGAGAIVRVAVRKA